MRVFGGSNLWKPSDGSVFGPRRDSRSAVTRGPNALRCYGLTGHLPEATHHGAQVTHPERLSPAWWTSKGHGSGSGLGKRRFTISHYGRASSTGGRWWDLFLTGMFSAGNFPQPLDMEFCLEALEIGSYRWAESHRSSHSIRGVSSPPVTFVARLKTEGDQISWSVEGAATTNPGGETMGGQSIEEVYLRATAMAGN